MVLRRLGIDLGTATVLVHVPQKGIVIQEPSVVAIETIDDKIVAIGTAAKQMLGRTPDSIIAAHPLKDGVIANFRITEAMLRHYLNQLSGRIRLFKPDIMISAPAGITSTERRAVMDACLGAGAKHAYLIKEPIAAALGANIPIASPSGNMIVDIGAGTTEVAVVALGDIVASTSVRIGGNRFDHDIANYIRKKYNLVIGDQTAEDVKIKIGSVLPLDKDLTLEISGSNAISGLPESILVTTSDVVNAIKEALNEIIGALKIVLQKTPPELASDIMDKGIVMTGGSSKFRKIDELMTKVTGVPCQVADDPELCVVRGTGIAVEHLDEYRRSMLWTK
ncbi:MAG TPA: rod shape-determining protein [Patescibacteria group bacterium]